LELGGTASLAIWLTFAFEWVVIPFFYLVFLSQKGKVTRVFSIFFAILGLPLIFSNQYFILDNGTTLTEVTSAVYPTPLIQIAWAIHGGLIALAAEFLFTDLDRDTLGRAPKGSGRRFSKK
jgi:hypothetical protein